MNKNLENIRMGIDIDYTLIPEAKAFRDFINSNIDSSFDYATWKDWDLLFNVPEEKKDILLDYMKTFYSFSNMGQINPMDNCVDVLNKFNTEQLFFVTARTTWMFTNPKEETISWLKEHNVPHNANQILLQSDSDKDTKKCKSEIAKEQNLDLFFEDNPENALKIANSACPVILLDYPYNRQITHEKIIRVGKFNDETGSWTNNPWTEISELFESGKILNIINSKK